MKKALIKSAIVLTKKKPEKGLLLTLPNRAGRNKTGEITVRHQGGGVKRRYRIVDFDQKKMDIPAKVFSIEYDPYRTGYIMLLEYADKARLYRLAPEGIKTGDEVVCKEKAEIKKGNRMKLKNIPVGAQVHDIELNPGMGGKMVRSAGSSARVLAHENKYVNLEMPSKEIRKVYEDCFATIGAVSHSEWRYVVIGKAGTSRRKGIRPAVRGSAMSPVDHPHGGGEGRAPVGLKYQKTPWGKPARGVKTRNPRKWTKKMIIQRRIKTKK